MTQNADSLPVDKDGRNPTEALLTDPATAELRVVEYRVACTEKPWRSAPIRDYTTAHDLRAECDDGTWRFHRRGCGPHRVEERIVVYGEWQ